MAKTYQPGRTMSRERYCNLLAKWKMTQREAGVFLGGTERTAQNFIQRRVPPAVAMLFNLMDFSDMPPDEVESILRSLDMPQQPTRQNRKS